jgi:membrane protease YdiL (CAAX protease family)
MERPPEPPARPAVPWGAAEIVLVLLLSYAAEAAVYQLLGVLGWFQWYYGELWPVVRDARPGDEAAALARARMWLLWVPPLALPLKVAVAVLLLKRTSRASLADLGLTRDRLGRSVLLGVLLAVALTAGAYAVNALMVLLVKALGGAGREHSFTRLIQQGLDPAEWALLVFSAVVAASVWEELFYRGIVQPWVIDRREAGGAAALGVALAVTVAYSGDLIQRREPPSWADLLPLLFLGGLAVCWGLLTRRSAALAGVFATAVLFAWVHMAAWPAPVALVWLAVGLGWVAHRTRSLTAPIVIHAAFNAVACVTEVWRVTSGG